MKTLCKIIFLSVLAALVLFASAGCGAKETGGSQERKGREYVRMSGTIPTYGQQSLTRGEMVYGPIEGRLPSRQLDIAIVTVNYVTTDPVKIQPVFGDWSNQTADMMRGFFGSDDDEGVLDPATKPTNGKIEFTNDTGEFIRRIFYPEGINEYFFVRAVYPYHNTRFTQMPDGSGAAVIFSGLTGKEDILASNLGWGAQKQPVIETNHKIKNPAYTEPEPPDIEPVAEIPDSISVLKFSHKLSQLRFWVVAENSTAREQYGDIKNIIVRFQPDRLALRIIDNEVIRAQDAGDIDFYLKDPDVPANLIDKTGVAIYNPDYDPSVNGNTPQGTYAGCMMVLPDYTYRFEADTGRNWIGADYDFKVNGVVQKIEPGKIYDVTFKFMEAYMLDIKFTAVKEWWMDSVFD